VVDIHAIAPIRRPDDILHQPMAEHLCLTGMDAVDRRHGCTGIIGDIAFV